MNRGRSTAFPIMSVLSLWWGHEDLGKTVYETLGKMIEFSRFQSSKPPADKYGCEGSICK